MKRLPVLAATAALLTLAGAAAAENAAPYTTDIADAQVAEEVGTAIGTALAP